MERLLPFAGIFLMGFLMFGLHSETISDPIETRVIPIKINPADTLQHYTSGSIITTTKLIIQNSTGSLKYFAPRFYDTIYLSGVFILIVITNTYFWQFSYKNPFTLKALWGIRLLTSFSFIFFIANFWRYNWYNEQVIKITHGNYEFDFPYIFSWPEVWLFFLSLRAMWLFKKGYNLQIEQDLTV